MKLVLLGMVLQHEELGHFYRHPQVDIMWGERLNYIGFV